MTKHVNTKNYSKEIEEYEKLISLSKERLIDVPIIFKEVKDSRGKCFYLNAKNMASTLEQQLQGNNKVLRDATNLC